MDTSLRGATATRQSRAARVTLDCSHGEVVCQDKMYLFVRLQPPLRPDRRSCRMARADRVKADPLGSPRSGLALTRSSTPSGLGGLGGSGGLTPFRQRSQVRAGLAIWFASQIKLTFGRRARRTAPIFRLRRAGSRGRGHSSLRLFEGHAIHRFVHPDRPRLIGPRRIGCRCE